MLVPSLNHIISNAEAQVGLSLPYWDTYVKQIKAAAKWASLQDNLNRFQETCLRPSAYWHSKRLFESRVPLLAEWRWGTMRAVMHKLKVMLPIFRLTWDPEKYKGEGRAPGG